MKSKIYIDTSVVGGCFDPEFAEWSHKLFNEFKQRKKIAVVSDLTMLELTKAPEMVRGVLSELPEEAKSYILFDEEANVLSQKYIKEKAITQKSLVDAQHIAIATIAHVDVLASWNFKHIVNLFRIRQYNAVNLKYGYPLLEIRSPREVLDER